MKSLLQRVDTVHILEALWLTAILIIPIVFVKQYFILSEADNAHAQVPKVALLRVVAGAMLVIYLYHIRNIQVRWPSSFTPRNLLHISTYSYATLIFISVLLVAISTLVTTSLSTNISLSIWGFIPGQDDSSAYNSICYLIIFTVVATTIRTPAQFRRLLLSIIAMGVLVSSVGFFQHFRIDIFGFLSTSDYSRATLTTGNALTAGSLLLIPILVTVGCLTTHLYNVQLNHGFNRAFIIKAMIWCVILSVQFSGLVYTYSRGPGIATISSIFLLFLTLIIFRKFQVVTIAALTVIISATLTFAVTSIPSTHEGQSATPRLEERIVDIKTQVVTGGLNQRTSIWKSSAELIQNRPWFESMDLSLPRVRSFIGYGPATFHYVFNLTSIPSVFDGLPIEAKHAHNYFIHQTVTQGILGLVSAVGLLASPILISGLLLITRRNNNTSQTICLVSILALFSGRLAEQLVGISAVSDLTVFWVSLAASVTAINLFSQNKPSHNEAAGHSAKVVNPSLNQSTQVFVLVLSSIGILFFTITCAIIYPVSGVYAGQSRSLYQDGKLEESLYHIETAISLTPEVPYYYFFKNIVLTEILDHPEKAIHHLCDRQANHIKDYQGYSLCLAQEMYSTASTAKKIEPFWYKSTYQFAIIAESFGQEREALQAYKDLAELLPTNRTALHWLARQYITREMFEDAQNSLKQSLSISESNPESGNNEFFTSEAIELLNKAG